MLVNYRIAGKDKILPLSKIKTLDSGLDFTTQNPWDTAVSLYSHLDDVVYPETKGLLIESNRLHYQREIDSEQDEALRDHFVNTIRLYNLLIAFPLIKKGKVHFDNNNNNIQQ
jgi:hypothetical protein